MNKPLQVQLGRQLQLYNNLSHYIYVKNTPHIAYYDGTPIGEPSLMTSDSIAFLGFLGYAV